MTRGRDHVRFSASLMATSLKGALAHRGAFVVQVAFMMLNNATFFVFWWALMRRVPQIGGWRLADMQFLFGLVATSFGLAVTLAGGALQLGRLIEEGELDTLLTQPRPVLQYLLGFRMQASGVGDAISGVAFIVWSGRATWETVPLVLLAVAVSTVGFVASTVALFSAGFWLARANLLSRQVWELLLTFSMYPEPLFGGVLRVVLFTILPAGLIAFWPARMVRDQSWASAALLVVAMGFYVRVAVYVFHRGLARYASGSRFGTFG